MSMKSTRPQGIAFVISWFRWVSAPLAGIIKMCPQCTPLPSTHCLTVITLPKCGPVFGTGPLSTSMVVPNPGPAWITPSSRYFECHFYLVSATDITPTYCWLNVWCIRHTQLETVCVASFTILPGCHDAKPPYGRRKPLCLQRWLWALIRINLVWRSGYAKLLLSDTPISGIGLQLHKRDCTKNGKFFSF